MQAETKTKPPFGQMLRQWRGRRGMSQLALAVESEVSQRHISFVESGRAAPSREMILKLSQTLGVPLRHQNLLLVAGGYAPVFREGRLQDAAMEPMRKALEFMLRQQEPYPAMVVDSCWNVLMSNQASSLLALAIMGPERAAQMAALEHSQNILHIVFDPDALRPFIRNWEEVATVLLQRV